MSGWTSKRDYTAGRAKVDEEGVCRSCGTSWQLEAAHLVARARIGPGVGEDPRNILPLCRACHSRFDRQATPYLDVLPLLTPAEMGFVAEHHPGGILGGLEAVTNARWTEAA